MDLLVILQLLDENTNILFHVSIFLNLMQLDRLVISLFLSSVKS